MTPFSQPEEGHHNWRFIVIVIWLIVFTVMTSYALKQSQDATDTNRELITEVHMQQVQIEQNAKEAAYKLCVSVKRGKLDRIDEYRFTINRTKEFFKENPQADSSQMQRAVDFYNDLIQRTQDQLVPCPKP